MQNHSFHQGNTVAVTIQYPQNFQTIQAQSKGVLLNWQTLVKKSVGGALFSGLLELTKKVRTLLASSNIALSANLASEELVVGLLQAASLNSPDLVLNDTDFSKLRPALVSSDNLVVNSASISAVGISKKAIS